MNFNKIPFVRIALPFIWGIIFNLYIEISTFLSLFLLISSFLLLVFFHFSSLSKKYIFSFFFGYVLLFFFFFSGVFLSKAREIKQAKIDISAENQYIAIIDDNLQESENFYKTTLKVEQNINNPSEKENYLVLVYFRKDSKVAALQYGDKIVLSSKFQEIKPKGNPNEFDFPNYLAKKGIFYQAFLEPDKFQFLEKFKGFSIFYTANNFRNTLLEIYKRNGIEGDELAVLSALTLGYKNYLDIETKQAFTDSGAMHILSVSGLHVGIILGFLMLIFRPFGSTAKIRLIKVIVIVFSLWAFALISGLSPSVLRATLMFTFVAIGDYINRSGSIYNSLWASASLLMLYSPINFLDIGFQLSYLAVFSIVSFQPAIYKSLYVPSKVGNYIWELVSVSIAAQLGTLPISIFYFNQFPVYFIFTNIVVIPLSFFITYLAIVLLLTAKIAFISKLLGTILYYSVYLLNNSVNFITKLPFSTIQGMQLNLVEMFLFYFFILFAFLFFVSKRKYLLKLTIVFLFILSSSNFYSNYKKAQKSTFVVFNISKSTMLNFATNTENIVICDTSLQKNELTINFAAKNFWTQANLLKPQIKSILNLNEFRNTYKSCFFDENFIMFKNKKIGILGYNNSTDFYTNKRLKLDFIVLSKNAKITISEVLEFYDVKKIIIDSSNSFTKIKKWQEEASQLGIDLHFVSLEGAFVYSF